MMVSARDFLHVAYSPDLTEAGIAYAIRSLPYSFDRAGRSPHDRLRRVVASVAVELAFRRYLSQQDIPFEVQAATPFTAPDRYDVLLGGHRCDLQTFLISQREKISLLRRDPQVLLNAPALVPADAHTGSAHAEHDLYVFVFVTGLIAASTAALKKAAETGQPHYLLHVMGAEWRQPPVWGPLGPLTLKSESDRELLIEISGQDPGREYLTRALHLLSRSTVAADDPFYALTAVHAADFPTGRLEIYSPTRNATHVIRLTEWGNIWVYGMDIYLAGYISHQDFHQQARSIAPASRVFQADRTGGKNLAVAVSDLSPLGSLFENVRAWDRDQAR